MISKLILSLAVVSVVGTGIFSSATLTVKAAEEEKHTVIFEVQEGNCEVESISVAKGESLTLPEASYEGHYFSGWVDITTDGGSTIFKNVGLPGDTYTPERDMWLYALWKPLQEAVVNFDADGGEMEGGNLTAKVGDTIMLPACSKDGYEFTGWYDNDTYVGQMGEGYTVSGDVILKAHYLKEEEPECTVNFDADGGVMEGGSLTAKVGDTITLLACTKDGYEITGWYDNDTCIGQAGEEYTVSGNVIMKAHYRKNEETVYTVTFDTDGGKEAEPIKMAKGKKVKLPGTEKAGHVFLGWYTGKEGGALLGIAGDEIEVEKDMFAYALWEKEKTEETGDKTSETYKAVFHTNGGTLRSDAITIVKGANIYLPLPEKDGYSFCGWYLDQSLTQFAGAYRDAYHITQDTDFFAKWEKNKKNGMGQGNTAETIDTYIVKYDANGGTTKETFVKVVKGARVKLPAAEREGFDLKGWYTDKQVFIGIAGDTYKPDSDISLYAGWEEAADGDGNAKSESSPDANVGASEADPVSGKADVHAENVSRAAVDTSKAVSENGPVIQTGRISSVSLFASIGMAGILLVAFAAYRGKHCLGE